MARFGWFHVGIYKYSIHGSGGSWYIYYTKKHGIGLKESTINESQSDSMSDFFQPVTLIYVSYISEKSWERAQTCNYTSKTDVW